MFRWKASMGPRSIDRGNVGAGAGGADAPGASMGPRSIDRGNNAGSPNSYRNNSLQWGRDQSIAEIGTPSLARRRQTCFNGAAINRSRKYADRQAGSAMGSMASMGPRSIDRGNQI